MANYAIVTDLNRCVGCLACTVACKAVNELAPGTFRIRAVRVGPNLKPEGSWPHNVEMYFLPMQCQHCANPACVDVCPTGASRVAADGSVQIDAEACIGCGACIGACPYQVRQLDLTRGVVDKCDLCESLVEQGRLPQCVSQCQARARFFGDLDEGVASFEGPAEPAPETDRGYGAGVEARVRIGDYLNAFDEGDVHYLRDAGNAPKFGYILRNRTWHDDVVMPEPGAAHNVAPLKS